MSINKKRFFTIKRKYKEIFRNKKGLKRFSLMITHEKKILTGIMNKERFSQIKVSSSKKIICFMKTICTQKNTHKQTLTNKIKLSKH